MFFIQKMEMIPDRVVERLQGDDRGGMARIGHGTCMAQDDIPVIEVSSSSNVNIITCTSSSAFQTHFTLLSLFNYSSFHVIFNAFFFPNLNRRFWILVR